MEEMEADIVEVSPPSPRPISRCTRSHAAPEWTVQETLTLANEVAAVEEDCRRALSTYQKWEIIAANCSAILGGTPRRAYRCRRLWDAILADYRRIQAWKVGDKPSYWSLDTEGRRVAGLPRDFDREVFGTVARWLRAQERGADAGDVESESDQDVAAGKDDDDDDDVIVVEGIAGSRETTQAKACGTATRMQDVACKLRENAQHVHAILAAGEAGVGDAKAATPPEADLNKPSSVDMALRRGQADELIRALGSLVSTLDHFAELARGDGRGPDGI